MRKSIDAVNADFASVRAGRANASVLDRISVDYYGSPTPIQQIAAIASPDPRQLVITPWDGTALKPIERAIQESDPPEICRCYCHSAGKNQRYLSEKGNAGGRF